MFLPGKASRGLQPLLVFGAGEAKQISSIRKILKQKFDLKADQMSFTGYWKRTD